MKAYLFLIPLLFGFASNLASAFTTVFSRRWGIRGGSLASVILRDVLGIPIWAIGFGLAFNASSPFLLAPKFLITILGWLSIVIGGAVIIVALITIRLRSVAPSTQDALAQVGIYAQVRHPIHSGTLLEFLGVLLIDPSLTVAIACTIGIAWVFLQTMFEEQDLLLRLPAYREYMARVPRFLPRQRAHPPASFPPGRGK